MGAPLFYREVNLPFIDAVTDPSKIRWRFGSISSPQPPPVVLTGLPVCGNCHSFTPDGRTLAMDVDYANSKGSYVITPVKSQMVLATSDIITWDDYKKGGWGADVRAALPGVAGRPVRGQHGQRQIRFRAHAGVGVLATVLPDQGDSVRLRPADKGLPRLARRGRSRLRAEQSKLESGRQVHRFRPRQGLRSPEHQGTGQGPADAGGVQGVRRGRQAVPVRPVPHPVQRRQGRRGGADPGRVEQRHEQLLRAVFARWPLDRLLQGQELHASPARQRAVHPSV